MEKLIDTLHREKCSLVLRDGQGRVRTFWKAGVRDLEDLLQEEPETLRGATIADKVVGKAAAGMMVVGGVADVYADVLSRAALPLLDAAGMRYSCGTLVDQIIIAEGDERCPLEQIVAPAKTAGEVVEMLFEHFKSKNGGNKH
ncbi:MAG: DUF1893 domain-containing protein [Prevotella sp.]|nr:DUF1893 domain-containing protein [Prevotella sp.]